MSRPNTVHFVFLSIGVTCAALLVWLWRQNVPAVTAPAVTTQPVKPEAISAPQIPAGMDSRRGLSPELQAMLMTLAQVLARGDARDREAVMAFKDDAAYQRFLARAQRAGLSVLGQLDALRSVRVRYDSLTELQRDLMDNASDYSDVAANGLVGIPQPPPKQDRANVNQVPFGNDTLAFVGATGDRSGWGRGTTIAILDTGVAADATFGNSRLRTLDIGLGISPGVGGEDGHGTAIAALAAGGSADAGGVAPAANLLSIRVTDASGTSDLFTVARGILAAVDAGAKIINVSLGGYSNGAVLDAAINYAEQRGAIIVAAAGNDQAAQLAWPAADSRVVSVGAIDKAEQQVSFSNSGPQLQLTAPGYGVQTAWLNGQRVYMDGTSASSPIVAGAIAALISQNPSLSPRQAAELLARTANDVGQAGADPAYGRGILNLATAMNSSNPLYVDTAVSSHFYNAETDQMQFVVQNRSGRPVTGLSLSVSVGPTTSTQPVPTLAAGETYVARVRVNDATLQTAGSLSFSTQLVNPLGTVDQVPKNNLRSSVLTAPKPTK